MRRTKRRFDTNSPAPIRDRDPRPRQPEDGPIPLFDHFEVTRKAAKSLECRNRAIKNARDDYDNIYYKTWLQVSIEPTRFVDPDVVQALGIRSDLEDLFVELGMGNFATHPQVLDPELVRQFMDTVNVYYIHERANKASEGVLTIFIRGIRYRVPLLTLCTIYGFETERQHATVPDFPGIGTFWSHIATGFSNPAKTVQTDIRHPIRVYYAVRSVVQMEGIEEPADDAWPNLGAIFAEHLTKHKMKPSSEREGRGRRLGAYLLRSSSIAEDEDGVHLVRLPLWSLTDFSHGLNIIQFRPDPRRVRAPAAQPRSYTVQRPGGPQPHQPEDALPPFPPMPDMSTRREGDFQCVVVDALSAIWARVSRCRCSSRRSVRASSPPAGGVCEPAHRQQHMDTLQLAQTFSVSALSIDNETVTSIDRDAVILIDYEVYMSIDPRDKGFRYHPEENDAFGAFRRSFELRWKQDMVDGRSSVSTDSHHQISIDVESLISRIKSKPDLALDSSSICGSVRSKKQRSGAGPSESMDSSGSSLQVENPSRTVRGVASLSPEIDKFLLVGPLSSIGVIEVASWRVKYHLPDDVIIRILGPVDWVSDFEAEEVPVYEGFFESSFRDRVSSLVAKVSEALEISPGQLNPPSWKIRIALQKLGDLEGCRGSILIRYHPLERWGTEIPSAPSRRRAPGSGDREEGDKMSPDIPSVDPSLGERTIKQVLELPIERRQVPFFVSKEALERCSIWGNMSGSKGEEALAEYMRALEVMSAKKAAPKKTALSENDDEVQFIRSNKRQAATALASSLKNKSKASGSTPRVSPSLSSDPAMVLANLNAKVFPLTPVVLPEGDSSPSIQFIQGDLLQAMSELFHLGERMGDHASLKADLAELTSKLREEKDNVLAKEKEIKTLKLKVRNQDEAGSLAAAENVSLREQLEQREEEVCDLRCAAETFDAEKTMAVSGAIVLARWELMREWLNHQTDS
ncbi:hypothetical protein F2Q69_00006851 [Brassica cretica]|uniref:Arabidopsis retrotransposon Orf1 C-terminal domain-containing protein n=1 Tax=Brassica cretica TaxID=69181 RepID=A0A8S9PEI9_BRACR|nr:hypothetical protein F2Q69_00006851 [Brassica cretica]